MFDITDIGRKLFIEEIAPFLCIGVINATLNASGTIFSDKHELKM